MIDFNIKRRLEITNDHFPNRVVYWSVLDHETSTSTNFTLKFDALNFKQTLRHATIYFHWYEDQFSKIPIQIEPPSSLDELCRLRAQELRDTYRYLRLYYSGGVDSHTALLSFVDNNIHLDEIIVYMAPDTNKIKTESSTSRDVLLSAIPNLKEISSKIPNTKITITSATDSELEAFFDVHDELSDIPYFHSLDIGVGMFAPTETILHCRVATQQQPYDHCDIVGGSKVRLYKNKDKWYYYFVDTMVGEAISSIRSEDFFISKKYPELYLKTVHNVKNFCVVNKYSDATVNSLTSGSDGRVLNIALGRKQVNKIAQFKMYTTEYIPKMWDDMKLSGTMNILFYKNIIGSSDGEKWFKNYQNNMTTLTKEFSYYWEADPRGIPNPLFGVKGHLSKFYCLTDGKIYDSIDAMK